MASKPTRVVTYNEEVPFIKSHDPRVKWSGDFDFLLCDL